MAYTYSSKYVQITPFLVMEYLYADQPTPESYFVNTGSPTVGYNKLVNNVLKDEQGNPLGLAQIFNRDQDYSVTQNTSLNSVVMTGENTFITLNPNLIVPYNDFNSDLTPTSGLPVVFPANLNIIYDSVRYHILSGYNLENLDGLVLGIDFPDVDGTHATVSQILLEKGNALDYTLNPYPVTIGIDTYDKYFEVKIPSFVDMNNKYIAAASSAKPDTLAGKISRSGKGFIYGAPLRVRFYSIGKIFLTNGYETYNTESAGVLSLESEDPFKNIGAYIAPADTGDFFEYFGTDNGGFIEDFILFQNSIGNSYYIQNNIEVLEQIGAAFVNTSNFYTQQTNSYDTPNLYRPIIKNASVAASFTLRYTMTLVNTKDQTRITRTASYTSPDPYKYGPYIAPLTLQSLPQSQKIYNKVLESGPIGLSEGSYGPTTVIKYSNVFVDQNLVTATTSNLVVKGSTITQADGGVTNNVALGMGNGYIYVKPFDNYYKFTFYQSTPNGDPQTLDLQSSGTYYITFIDNTGAKVMSPSLDNKNISNPSKGELAFKVDEETSKRVLNYTDRRFYISNRPPEEKTKNTLSTNTEMKNDIAKRSFSLNDSVNDAILSAKESLNFLDQTVRVIKTDSTSVLYWGSWLKDGEPAPATNQGATGAFYDPSKFTLTPIGATSDNEPLPSNRRDPFWKKLKPRIDTILASPDVQERVQNAILKNAGSQLTFDELKTALSSDVQGKINIGWAIPDIVAYFLDPGQIGYKLYEGITKDIFGQAVSGIFNDSDMQLLNKYGNTYGGRLTETSTTSDKYQTDQQLKLLQDQLNQLVSRGPKSPIPSEVFRYKKEVRDLQAKIDELKNGKTPSTPNGLRRSRLFGK